MRATNERLSFGIKLSIGFRGTCRAVVGDVRETTLVVNNI